MKTSEKLDQIFSPLDVVVIKKKYEFLYPRDSQPDIPEDAIKDAKIFLMCGEYANRNPSLWHVFQGEDVDSESDRWVKGIKNLLRLSCTLETAEIDNKNNHASVDIEFVLLAINAKTLPETVYEGVKCANVQTSYGTYPLIVDEDIEEPIE